MSAKIKTTPQYKKRRHKNKPRGVAKHDFEKVYWPYLPLLFIIGLLFSLGVQSGAMQATIKNSPGKTLDYALSMNIDRLLSETNIERSKNGTVSLKLNSKLYAAAQSKADDMAEKNYWSHNTPAGEAPWVFVAAQDYKYQKLGENLATGFLDEDGTVSGWMASEGHRRNLLDPAFTEVGFGVANNSHYTSAGGGPMTIIVAMYGKPLVASAVAEASPAKTDAGGVPSASGTSGVSPANTDNLSASTGAASASPLSGGQIALANLPFASAAKGLFIIVMLAAIGLWMTKHAFALRRVFAEGEAFMIRHPLIDISLILIALLALILTQTVGIVG